MAFISINLNLAYRKMYKCNIFKPEIASSKGIKNLSKFKKLILIETFSAALISALAITIWSKITLYAPDNRIINNVYTYCSNPTLHIF